MFPVIWWIGKGFQKSSASAARRGRSGLLRGKSAFEGPDALQVGNPPQTLPFNEKTPVPLEASPLINKKPKGALRKPMPATVEREKVLISRIIAGKPIFSTS